MVKSYCVKQKKQTDCVEQSGYKTTKNGRLMFFCTCAECGITKTKFVKSQTTGSGFDELFVKGLSSGAKGYLISAELGLPKP